MRLFGDRSAVLIFGLAAVLFSAVPMTPGQRPVPVSAPGKTIFRDSDGQQISNNEFVDIRMANFHYRDATVVRTLDDGTVEFRLQKIPQEGMAAPDLAVRTIEGRTIALRALRERSLF
ncbi:MAG: hypothetical protein AB7J13_09335 [Pyrinomonadaceae bacterium]